MCVTSATPMPCLFIVFLFLYLLKIEEKKWKNKLAKQDKIIKTDNWNSSNEHLEIKTERAVTKFAQKDTMQNKYKYRYLDKVVSEDT